MTPIIVIPSRLESTRLPRKPLADIGGKPMILRAWECAVASGVGKVLVACDSTEIADVILKAGGEVVLTDPLLPSGSDRVKAALDFYDPQGKYNVVVNLQGDMPFVDKAIIVEALALLEHRKVDISTLAYKITNAEDVDKPSVVKVAVCGGGVSGRALYFSRSPVPHGAENYYCHIGIYGYRREALKEFVSLPPSYLENCEKLEQLRALENGMRIEVKVVPQAPISVDTAEDLECARRMAVGCQ